MKKVWKQLFAFLSSLQLAVVLLFSLAAILAVGTFYESAYDADTARHYIYGTRWFVAVLVLLGINVFFAGLSRYPWKRHHAGFLVVHLGIITILVGSLITLFWGYEGQLIIPEGESRNRIFLSQSSLYFYEGASGKLEELPADFRFQPPSQETPFGGEVLGDILIKVNEYIPHAQPSIKVLEGNGPYNPALKVGLSGSRAQMEEWIFSRDYLKQRVDLGPASMNFIEVPKRSDLEKIIKNKKLRGPVLWVEGRWIPLKGNLGKDISWDGKTVFIENYLPHARVFQGKLINRDDQPVNPVVLLSLKNQGRKENHRVFAKFSEMPTEVSPSSQGPSGKHLLVPEPSLGQDNSRLGKVRLFWIPEDLGEKNNELLLAKVDDGTAYRALKNRGEWGPTKKLVLGETIPTGWMDFQLTVAQAFNRAQVRNQFRRVAVPKGKQGPPPAIRIQVASQDELQDLWLGRGFSEDITLGNRSFKLAYALKSLPLGFEVKLKKFIMGTYEGTADPSSYESEVTLIDGRQRIQRDQRIKMNQPLVHDRYKVFQASYQLNPNGPDWSVFSVAYDPGILIKYIGSIVLILGIIIIFFFRKAYMVKKVKVPVGQGDANVAYGASLGEKIDTVSR